jgi:hypothetical protein
VVRSTRSRGSERGAERGSLARDKPAFPTRFHNPGGGPNADTEGRDRQTHVSLRRSDESKTHHDREHDRKSAHALLRIGMLVRSAFKVRERRVAAKPVLRRWVWPRLGSKERFPAAIGEAAAAKNRAPVARPVRVVLGRGTPVAVWRDL